MPDRKAISSLGQVEDRLRRLLNLAGAIGTTFEPAMIPVVIAGDVRDPGYSAFRGRRFFYGSTFTTAGNFENWYKVGTSCVITRWTTRCSVAAIPQRLRVQADTSVADVAGLNTQFGLFENPVSNIDSPPLLRTAEGTTGLGTTGTVITASTGAVNDPQELLEQPLVVLGGTRLCWNAVGGAATYFYQIEGYVF